jgi:hypothetical protein
MHAVGIGLATLRGPANDGYLIQLLDAIEADKGQLSPEQSNKPQAQVMAGQLATKYHTAAAGEDRAGKANSRTVQTYRMAALISAIAASIDTQSPIASEAGAVKQTASSRADYLQTCFKSGSTPKPLGQAQAASSEDESSDDDEPDPWAKAVCPPQPAPGAGRGASGGGGGGGGAAAQLIAEMSAPTPAPAPTPAVSAIPVGLKPIEAYLLLANNFANTKPVLAYYARMHAVQVGLATLRSSENDMYLIKLLDSIEADKKQMVANGEDAITNSSAAFEQVMTFALQYSAAADQDDHVGLASMRTVQQLHMASNLFEVAESIKHKEPALANKAAKMKEHATSRATVILTALKSGQPVPPVAVLPQSHPVRTISEVVEPVEASELRDLPTPPSMAPIGNNGGPPSMAPIGGGGGAPFALPGLPPMVAPVAQPFGAPVGAPMIAPIAVPVPSAAPSMAPTSAPGAVSGLSVAPAGGRGWVAQGTAGISIKTKLGYVEKMEIEKNINLAVKALSSGNSQNAEVVVQYLQDALKTISN